LTPFLAVRGISKRFAGVEALRDVTLELRRGEIRCLVGENGSGKSTLVKILAGVHRPDTGKVHIGKRSRPWLRPVDAIRSGIQIIYQDLSLFPNLTVEENLAMNTLLERRRRLVNWKEVRRIATEATAKVGLDVNLSQPVSTLSLARRQLVAIARALLHNAQLLIMDEPTSALTHKEVERLFDVVRALKQEGMSILFVSHKLDEVLEMSETVTVLRNGEKVSEGKTRNFDQRSLIRHMTGRALEETRYQLSGPPSETTSLLRLDRLTRRGRFENVSFEIIPGDVVGLTGLLGSGRTALARSLFGIEPADSGAILVEGCRVCLRTVNDAIDHRIAYVPEDRLTEGLFLEQSIERNIVVGILDRLRGRFGLVAPHRTRESARQWIQTLDIKTPDTRSAVANLSGGNQQKAVLARWLATAARVWILNGPTAGVDIGAKMDIHRRIRELAERGLGVLIISDDLPELVQTCNRVLVMHLGRIVEEISGDRLEERNLASTLNELH
jgi:simple sugar transport system ATP-binding protein